MEGVQPPAKKQKLTEEEKKEREHAYEKEKRNRKFMEAWKVGRKWLKFSDNKMTCTWCIDYAKKGKLSENERRKLNFTSGCANLKLNTVIAHEKSEFHRKSTAAFEAKQNGPDKAIASKVLQTMNANVFSRMKNLFRNAHALIKHKRPFTDFLWLCELDEVKGVDVGKTYLVALDICWPVKVAAGQ